MSRLLLALALTSLTVPASAGKFDPAAARAAIAQKRTALYRAREALVTAPPTTQHFNLAATVGIGVALRGRVGIAKTNVGGKTQLRLVAGPSGMAGAAGFWLSAEKSVSQGAHVPFIEETSLESKVPLVGAEDIGWRDGNALAVGLGFTAGDVGETRTNLLRIPITPKFSSLGLSRLDYGLSLAREADAAVAKFEQSGLVVDRNAAASSVAALDAHHDRLAKKGAFTPAE